MAFLAVFFSHPHPKEVQNWGKKSELNWKSSWASSQISVQSTRLRQFVTWSLVHIKQERRKNTKSFKFESTSLSSADLEKIPVPSCFHTQGKEARLIVKAEAELWRLRRMI